MKAFVEFTIIDFFSGATSMTKSEKPDRHRNLDHEHSEMSYKHEKKGWRVYQEER